MSKLSLWVQTLPTRLLILLVMVAILPVGLILYLMAMGWVLFCDEVITAQPKPETKEEQEQREATELYSIWGQNKGKS